MMLLLARLSRQCGLMSNRLTAIRQDIRTKCSRSPWAGKRWIYGTVLILLTAIFIILLVLYSQQAKHTIQVSRMSEAEYCYVDFVGHKSLSLKETSCCEVWLGVVCKRQNNMPCPSISVHYKLPDEGFERAGYINYWNPRNLIVRYATNSHCMIVPITCPESEDKVNYSQAEAGKDYSVNQSLSCHIYKDAPERPLMVKAKMLPHVSLAMLLFIVPPLSILVALLACIVTKDDHAEDRLRASVAVDKLGERIRLSRSQQDAEDEQEVEQLSSQPPPSSV